MTPVGDPVQPDGVASAQGTDAGVWMDAGRKAAFGQLTQLMSAPSAMGTEAVGAGMDPRRKIERHLSGAWRQGGPLPSPEYRFVPGTGAAGSPGYEVRNPNQRLAAVIDAGGVTVRSQAEPGLVAEQDPGAAAYLAGWSVGLPAECRSPG